jgi:hypothetical protein
MAYRHRDVYLKEESRARYSGVEKAGRKLGVVMTWVVALSANRRGGGAIVKVVVTVWKIADNPLLERDKRGCALGMVDVAIKRPTNRRN